VRVREGEAFAEPHTNATHSRQGRWKPQSAVGRHIAPRESAGW